MSFLAIVLSITSLIILLSNRSIVLSDINTTMSLIGIFITALAFTTGAYFALLAVSAYAHVKDIEKIKKTIEEQCDTINNQLSEVRNKFSNMKNVHKIISKNMITTLDDFLSHQIYIDKFIPTTIHTSIKDLKIYLSDRRCMLIRIRSRLALKFTYMERERRINLLRELAEVGELSDLPLLRAIIDNKYEEDEIRNMSKTVIYYIMIKYKKE